MDIIAEIKQQETQCIVEGLSMMTYNPSIGRVLEKGGVNKFVRIMVDSINRLEIIEGQEDFDAFHDEIVEVITSNIRTNRNQELSYGQAQKPLNVFLKVYVDWANKPQLEIANRLRKLLHVPLDSILMREVKEKFGPQFESNVVTTYAQIRESFRDAFSQSNNAVTDKDLAQIINPCKLSLDSIRFKQMYYAWQTCLREIYQDRPVLLDVLWSMKRRGNFDENGILD